MQNRLWGLGRRVGLVSAVALGCLGVTAAQAQVATDIRTDGRLGAALTLPGPKAEIPASLGRQAGKNLFHSFERFSIGTNDIATFTGPPGLDNVISRVTGGVRSAIDGTLRSTIPGADFWFINPAGLTFGPNASLDLPASFHVSTADELRFGDGLAFNARDPSETVLSSAPPEAFGFLRAKPASIELQPGLLQVPDGEVLSFVGGDINAVNVTFIPFFGVRNIAELLSISGQINLISLASPGTVKVDGSIVGNPIRGDVFLDNVFVIATGEATGRSRIVIRAANLTMLNDARVIPSAFSASAGATGVTIDSSGTLLMAGSEISAGPNGQEGFGGDIDIRAALIVAVNSTISAETNSLATAGNVRITADGLGISDSTISSGSEPFSGDGTAGDSGSITINAKVLMIQDGARIRASTSSEGKGGAVIVTGNVIQLENGGSITSTTEGSGAGGLILVAANEEIRMSKGSAISGETFGTGDAGQVGVGAPRIFVDNSFIGANTRGTMEDAGKGGPVVIIAGKVKLSDEGPEVVADGYLEFTNEGRVFTGTEGPGAAGNIRVDAGTLVADKQPIDHEHINHTGISASSQAGSSGNGGSVTVNAHAITLRNGAQITSDTKGTGNAGDVSINTRTLHLENGGLIATCSGAGPDCNQRGGGPDQTGDAGNITVQASDQIIIEDARITTFAVSAEASGGTITLNTGNLIDLHGGEISSEVLGNQGTTAGNIVINSPFLILNDSRIIARATEGKGGDIDIVADNLLRSSESIIDASAETGIDGTVVVSSPEADVTSGLVVLPAEFVDAGSRMKESCAIRGAAEASRFDRAGRALPPGPSDPQVATYAPDSDESAEGDKGASEHLAFAGWGVGEARIVCGATIE